MALNDNDLNAVIRTEEQELLAERVKEFVERNVTQEALIEARDNRHPIPGYEKAMLEAGFSLMNIPEELGGITTSMKTRCILMEELAHNAGSTLPNCGIIALKDVCDFGTPEQSERFLKHFFETGNPGIAMGISEPNAGSDNRAMTTYVREENGKLILSGTKCFCSGAKTASHLMVVAKDDDPARENRSMSWWLIPADLPGISMVESDAIGVRMDAFSDVYFDDVEIDANMLLGKRGEGWFMLMKNFETERLLVMATPLGLAQAAMDEAAAYAGVRETFGKPIGSYQLIQEKLVSMQVKINNMRNTVYKLAWEYDHGCARREDFALIKWYVPQTAMEVANMAMDIMGGIGYTSESRISRIWKDLKGFFYTSGTTEIMVYVAGPQLIKRYAK